MTDGSSPSVCGCTPRAASTASATTDLRQREPRPGSEPADPFVISSQAMRAPCGPIRATTPGRPARQPFDRPIVPHARARNRRRRARLGDWDALVLKSVDVVAPCSNPHSDGRLAFGPGGITHAFFCVWIRQIGVSRLFRMTL